MKSACEKPDDMGRSLSKVGTVLNSLASSKLTASSRPFPPQPLGGFCAPISSNRGDTSSGSLPKCLAMTTLPTWSTPWSSCTLVRFREEEMVICVDEKTNLQPRPRLAPTLPTRPGSPTRLEHECKGAGALHLFACAGYLGHPFKNRRRAPGQSLVSHLVFT